MIRICLLFTFLLHQPALAQLVTVELNRNWMFRNEDDGRWMKATVPGTVHTDLLSNEKIPDPFFGNNEPKLLWVEKQNWVYETSFDIDPAVFNMHHVDLVFNGLDTYADVYLNGALVLQADNMFRSWKIDIKKLARLKNNQLTIKFSSAQNRVDSIACARLPFVLPDNPRVYVRKAQYHFGWDWGPKFTTCGIWRPVKIEAWNNVKIEDIFIREILLDTLRKENELVPVASILAEITIHSVEDKSYNIFLSDGRLKMEGAKRPLLDEIRSDVLSRNFIEVFERVVVKKGINTYQVAFGIRNPELWWCNGLGPAKIYQLSCELFDASEAHAPPVTGSITPFAVRTIELIQEKDSVQSAFTTEATPGKRFYFRLNGVPVFMKGANYIPQSPFLPAVTSEHYQKIVTDAKEANMNMLRVWGGGVYEDDRFYKACDENGILVWQDFMFACAMYPGDKNFLKNVEEELIDNIKRLRNHPSIALWCGNNENSEAWFNWGWQNQYHLHGADSVKVWKDYEALFHELAPAVLSEYDPSRSYWPSSPAFGWGRKESYTEGDSHYWGIWHGSREGFDIESFETHTGRFVSEYGMMSLPSWSTIEKFAVPEERDTSSETMKVHMKNPPGYYKLGSYIDRYFSRPKDFEQFAFLSQCLQAYTLKYSIEKHRSMMPYCMGTLYWQMNDCWPVSSWSSIDGDGNWKAAHYAVQRAYENVYATVTASEKKYNILFINDLNHPIDQQLKVTLMDFTGRVYWDKLIDIKNMPRGSRSLLMIDSLELFKNISPASAVMRLAVADSSGAAGSFITNNLFYFTRPKDAALPKPSIHFRILDAEHIEVSTDVLARYVRLDIPGTVIHFSDNYFDLLPGESKVVGLKSKIPLKTLQKQLQIRSLTDTFEEVNKKTPALPGL